MRRYLFLLCFLLLALPGCVPQPDLRQNVVRAHMPLEPKGLNPVLASTAHAWFVMEYTQGTLTRVDMRTQQTIPLLLKELPDTTGGLQWKYALRDDVRWDDGSPLTSYDVLFSLKTALCPLVQNPLASTYGNVADLQPEDSFSFAVTFKERYFANSQIFNDLRLMQERWWDAEGILSAFSLRQFIDTAETTRLQREAPPKLAAWAEQLNKSAGVKKPENHPGLGPYRLAEWQSGLYMTLEKKQGWWGSADTSVYLQQGPDKIIFRFIPDDASVYLAFKKQELDVSTFIGTILFRKLREHDYFNEAYDSDLRDQYTYNSLLMNTRPQASGRVPLFDDARVRRAMAYLVPVDELNETIAYGYGTRQASFIQPGAKDYYNHDLPLLPFDPEKAAALLEEAGWRDTDGDGIRDKVIGGRRQLFRFKMIYPASPVGGDMAIMIREALARAGVDMVAEPLDGGTYQAKLLGHDYDMGLISFSGSAIPDDPAPLFHTSSWQAHGLNITGFGNAATDALIEESNRTIDPVRRAALLKQLQKEVYDRQPMIFTYSVQRKIVIHRRFDNRGIYVERPGVILNALKIREVQP